MAAINNYQEVDMVRLAKLNRSGTELSESDNRPASKKRRMETLSNEISATGYENFVARPTANEQLLKTLLELSSLRSPSTGSFAAPCRELENTQMSSLAWSFDAQQLYTCLQQQYLQSLQQAQLMQQLQFLNTFNQFNSGLGATDLLFQAVSEVQNGSYFNPTLTAAALDPSFGVGIEGSMEFSPANHKTTNGESESITKPKREYKKKDLKSRLERLERRKEKKSNRERARRITVNELYVELNRNVETLKGRSELSVEPKNRASVLQDAIKLIHVINDVEIPEISAVSLSKFSSSPTDDNLIEPQGTDSETIRRSKKSQREKIRRENVNLLLVQLSAMLGFRDNIDKVAVLKAAVEYVSKLKPAC